MHLLHLTQQYATAINAAVYGSFSRPGAQELVLAKGRVLELFAIDEGRFQRVARQDCFALIRGLATVKLAGQQREILVVTSDSGRLAFLTVANGQFKREACETYGKWSMRRVIPGQFLAADPKGRCVMVAAVEKDKLVFVTNRDAQDKLTVSSPLEANKSHAVVFAIVGLEVGYDLPTFAAIEVVYDDGERESKETPDPIPGTDGPKELVFYELDLGSNHVVRKLAQPVDSTANYLVAVPPVAEPASPAGVLVCSEDTVTFFKLGAGKDEPTKVLIPKRRGDDTGIIIVSSATFDSPQGFFALLQSERGDLFKVTTAGGLAIKYFDTVPVSTQLCITLKGLLFVACEIGDHELYQFKSIGDDDFDPLVKVGSSLTRFEARGTPRNLELYDQLRSLSPMHGLMVEDLAREEVPQLYTSVGTGPRSALKVLRQGLAVTELASTKLQGAPKGVWTVRDGEFDKLIIVSFEGSTKVLSIKDVVEEITTSGLTVDATTLAAGVWGVDGQLIQVTNAGIHRISLANGQVLQTWKTTTSRRVQLAAVNTKQIVLALAEGEVVYFEMDGSGGFIESSRFENGQEVTCLDCGGSEGGRPSRYLIIGSWDKSLKVLSLDNQSLMVPLSTQILPDRITSVALMCPVSANEPTRIEIGLSNGLLVRTLLDVGGSGVLVDTRTHVLGARPVRCQRVRFSDPNVFMTLCATNRPWLATSTSLTPISFMQIDFAAPFASQHAMDGLIVISGKTLRVVSLEPDFQLRFNEQPRALAYTPRRVIAHPNKKDVIVIEGELGVASVKQRKTLVDTKRVKRADDEMDMDEDDDAAEDGLANVVENQIGYPRVSGGIWTGTIRVLDPTANKTHQLIELDSDEVALSLVMCTLTHGDSTAQYLVVGSVVGMNLHPKSEKDAFKKGFLSVYKFVQTASTMRLELHHKTEVAGRPTALCSFDGALLAGVENSLNLYELGKVHLLKKCQLKGLPGLCTFVRSQGSERIVIGDSSDSVFFVHYSKQENSLNIFADDVLPRKCTFGEMVDYNTVACGDKNGNIMVLRLPPGATGDDARSRAASQKIGLLDLGQASGAAHKLDLVCHFFVGEVITGLVKCRLSLGHSETLVYTTTFGTIGTLCPFPSRDDLDFFGQLELHMRKHHQNLLGRDHLQFRSYYAPCKAVVDGDLCEMFTRLDVKMQEKIAKEMDKTPLEIVKRMEDARALVLW